MGALDGIRVIDAGLHIQGPHAALMLSDLGADVIKVELPEVGDQSRWMWLSPEDRRSAYFFACNRGKRSLTLDLRKEEANEAFLRLIETADVLISNFVPGTLDDWGLDYDTVAARNPRLIYATGSAFGTLGPGIRREGNDLVAQASGGLISTIGEDGTRSGPVGAAIADTAASQNVVIGVLAALMARERTGKGQRVDVSLFGSQIFAQAAEFTAYFLTGEQPGKANFGHGLLHTAYCVVPTADGHLAICGVPLHHRERFYQALDRPEMADDPRFQPIIYSKAEKKALFDIFHDVFPTRTTAEWCERLEQAGCRYAVVNDYSSVTKELDAWYNGYLIETDHPEWGKMPVVGSPIQLSETPAEPSSFAPEVGQHTEELLLELGYSWDDILFMNESGAT